MDMEDETRTTMEVVLSSLALEYLHVAGVATIWNHRSSEMRETHMY